jgi:signal transduction histidine kinase
MRSAASFLTSRFSRRYLLPPVAVGAALLLGWPLRRSEFDGISPLSFAAVMVCAWYGGLRAGLLATALSGMATAFFVMTPTYSLAVDAHDFIRLVLFSVVAVLTSSLHGATRRAAAEATKAKEAAEQANAAQNQFLAMVSHELRTPLNPILMAASLLERDERVPEDLRPFVQTIRESVSLEVRLIDDLLDLVRARHGKLHLKHEAVDVHRVLEDVIELCRPELEAKRIDIVLRLRDAPPPLRADPLRLKQVFWNLLRNAGKFTPAGGRVRVETRVLPSGSLAASISDTGIGIKSDRLTAIFEAFEQGGSDVTPRFGGLGLGLAICQALVAAHGGRISAASEGVGKGATFTVELPAAPDAATLPSSAAEKDGRQEAEQDLLSASALR